MAHEITNTDSLILTKKPAWHGIGTVVQDAPTPSEALAIAGLDWQVAFPDLEMAFFERPDGSREQIEIVRSRTLYRMPKTPDEAPQELFHFGPGYVPIQNADLAEMAYSFGMEAKVESAGSMQGGRKVFFLLKGETLDFGGDVVQPYLSLINSHDGILALSVFPTSVRVVCKNTLSMALNNAKGRMFKIAHSKNYQARLKECSEALKRYKTVELAFATRVEDLRAIKARSDKQVAEFYTKVYAELYGAPADVRAERAAMDEIRDWQIRLEAEMMELGVTTPDAWLIGNAVTGHLQHHEPGRATDGWEARRISSSFIGDIMLKSSKVMEMAVGL